MSSIDDSGYKSFREICGRWWGSMEAGGIGQQSRMRRVRISGGSRSMVCTEVEEYAMDG
jgi:hypothetical protein